MPEEKNKRVQKAKEKLDAWITMSNEEPPEPEEDE